MRPPLRGTQSSLAATGKILVWSSVRAECLLRSYPLTGAEIIFYFHLKVSHAAFMNFKKKKKNNDFDSVSQNVICFSLMLRSIHEAHRTANSRVQCQ